MYVDGFVIPVRKKDLPAYKRMARIGMKAFKKYGAIDFKECVADDLNVGFGLPFTKLAKPKPGETVVFSFIVYKNKAARDRANKLIMKDPEIAKSMSGKMPFDMKRMAVGGFKVMVGG